ncbi:class I SAM-dependent methyltransferase [Paenibacillus macquariensis]|uniref:Methyltransferase domain-containing protein n=1 Tax=Paenibacillus macquariensis TaxID=948756 RepID=A0ABY1K2J8_9BACL|nr:class I SAM-dependent methyltransferase [Paenibacillus macquariensis]MEC0090195.1 class I SAM-dependent methyltransferase [Paenibacillus macquariensis]OAB39568.1 hypothetical protein PMSM_00080 [Paenibacillus macquariensis subsp. macquariensis]SIR17150.1 Methyltransferase domain-containing protein [Paenibacillus macquariensis]
MNVYQHLRLLPVPAFNHYLHKRFNELQWVRKLGLDHIKFTGDFILIHAWKPGFVKLNNGQVELVLSAMLGRNTYSPSLPPLPSAWLEDYEEEAELDGVLNKVLVPGLFELLMQSNANESITSPRLLRLRTILEKVSDEAPIFPAIQNGNELKRFLRCVQQQKPKTVVEIGTASGGVFYCLSQLADPNALLVSIDYPGGPYGGGQDDGEAELYSKFGGPQQKKYFIRDRSFHHTTKQDLVNILEDRKIDLMFIDGDHSYGGVSSDYYMYKDLVAPGGVIAFHDINMRPETWGRGYDVGIFWNEIKHSHGNYEEIIDPSGYSEPLLPDRSGAYLAYGIGMLMV